MIRTKENSHLFKYQTNKDIKKKIDSCLHKISALQAQMIGIDSLQSDIDEFNKLIMPLKSTIRELDEDYYKELFPIYINKKEILKSVKNYTKTNNLPFDDNIKNICIYVIQECQAIMDNK